MQDLGLKELTVTGRLAVWPCCTFKYILQHERSLRLGTNIQCDACRGQGVPSGIAYKLT